MTYLSRSRNTIPIAICLLKSQFGIDVARRGIALHHLQVRLRGLVFPGPAGPVPVCPLGPVPVVCASTRGAAATNTARAPTRALPSFRNICIFSWSNIGYASLLTSTPAHARLGRAIRVYTASQEISCAGGSNSYATCSVGALCSSAGAESGVAVGPMRRLHTLVHKPYSLRPISFLLRFSHTLSF